MNGQVGRGQEAGREAGGTEVRCHSSWGSGKASSGGGRDASNDLKEVRHESSRSPKKEGSRAGWG